VAAECIRINFDLMAEFFQACDATFESSFVAHRAAGGINVNMSHGLIVAANATSNLGGI
jgi:hypothetical protein